MSIRRKWRRGVTSRRRRETEEGKQKVRLYSPSGRSNILDLVERARAPLLWRNFLDATWSLSNVLGKSAPVFPRAEVVAFLTLMRRMSMYSLCSLCKSVCGSLHVSISVPLQVRLRALLQFSLCVPLQIRLCVPLQASFRIFLQTSLLFRYRPVFLLFVRVLVSLMTLSRVSAVFLPEAHTSPRCNFGRVTQPLLASRRSRTLQLDLAGKIQQGFSKFPEIRDSKAFSGHLWVESLVLLHG